MEEYKIKIKRYVPLIVTFLVTFYVTSNVTAGSVYPHFTHELDGNRRVCFNSTTTYTTDDIASYHWDFGDGSSSERESPCHVYDFWSPQRDFIVSLTVIDEDGVENTYRNRITASNFNIYLAISLILMVGVFALGSQWKDIKRRVNG